MSYTLVIQATDTAEVLFVGDYATERSAKAQATKRLAAIEVDATADVVTTDGDLVHTDSKTVEVAVERYPARPWKVRVREGKGRSFAKEASARKWASEQEGYGHTVEVLYGEMNPARACSCGCGDETAGGRFLPGHDRKLVAIAERASTGDEAALAQLALAEVIVWDRDEVEGVFDPEVDCHPDCLYATGNTCRCSCAGANHNAGWGPLLHIASA